MQPDTCLMATWSAGTLVDAQPLAAQEVTVVADSAPLQIGREVLARVAKGRKLAILQTKGDWLEVQIPNSDKLAWIHRKYVQIPGEIPPVRLTGPASMDRSRQLLTRARDLLQDGRSYDALPLALEAYEICRRTYGNEHAETYAALSFVGGAYSNMNEFDKASSISQKILQFTKKQHGPEDPITIGAMVNYGVLLTNRGDPDEALPVLFEALRLRRKVLGTQHSQTLLAMQAYAEALVKLHKYDDADQVMREAVALSEQARGFGNRQHATLLSGLASISFDAGEMASARGFYEQCLNAYRQALGEEHSTTAIAYQNLGATLHRMGDWIAARRCHERSAEIRQKVLGYAHPHTSDSYYNLGLIAHQLGDTASARLNFEMAYKIRRKVYGEQNIETSKALAGLARVQVDEAEYTAAKSAYQQVLKTRTALLGKEHVVTASVLEDLANLHGDLGEPDEALPYAQQAVAICQKVLPENHPTISRSMATLCDALQDAGRAEESLRYAQQSLAMRQRDAIQGPYTSAAYQRLARVLAVLERWHQAAEAMEQARQIDHVYRAKFLPTLSETEQLQYLVTVERSLRVGLSLALHQPTDKTILETTAHWLVNGKAIGLEAMTRVNRLTSPAGVAKLQQLREVRSELARLSAMTGAQAGQAELASQMSAAQIQEFKLIRALGILAGEEVAQEPRISLQRLRQAIPPGAAFVDISQMRQYNYAGRTPTESWGEEQYVAWLIPAASEGEIQFVQLGDAKEIDRLVRAAREAIQLAPTIVPDQGELDAEQQAREKLQALAQRVFAPLHPHVKSANHLILSPDGLLWLAPWAAMPLESGEYLVEKYQIQYVNSGRDLVRSTPEQEVPAAAVVFADPQYDVEGATNQDPETTRTTSSSEDFEIKRLPRVQRLPATAAEAQAIRPSLDQFTGQATLLHMREEATEAAFHAVQRPRVLVLSTHGFFFPDQVSDPYAISTEIAQPRAALTTEGKQFESPLLRCGLLLAGCNRRGGQIASTNDGVLTGMEIVGADLRGTELVVLSACETGIGAIRNGEGVAGLRQAFQLAGAQSTAATLWQIPDVETALLMNEFFKNLVAGQLKAEALQQAQVTRIRARRERSGAAHPFYWAAFTLTGSE